MRVGDNGAGAQGGLDNCDDERRVREVGDGIIGAELGFDIGENLGGDVSFKGV